MDNSLLNISIGQYLFNELKKLGITEIFGIPGDYNFELLDILEEQTDIKLINCSNELNCGYAADGYARIKGISAMITTFGVGELSAVNAIAGAYSENVPIVHIVGGPKSKDQQEHKLLHHTLMNGDFNVFHKMYSSITETTAVISKYNAKEEIDRVLKASVEKKKPVYILISKDVCNEKIIDKKIVSQSQVSSQQKLKLAIGEVCSMINNSKNPVIISGMDVLRYNLESKVMLLSQKLGAPITTMLTGKSSVDESHENYIGVYCGNLINEDTRKIVEESDCVINVGEIFSDYNTGVFTSNLNMNNVISIYGDYLSIGDKIYGNVTISDVLDSIINNVNKKMIDILKVNYEFESEYENLDEPISGKYYFPRLQKFFKEGDIILADSGTFNLGLPQIKLPKDVTVISSYLWGSIGYATAATIGASIANKNRRTILLTGDGAHQLTVQGLSTMLNHNLKPIIFVLNNNGYTIERYLNKPKETKYNNIDLWNYTLLPKAFGKDIFTRKVSTNIELDDAIKEAEKQCENTLCYIEILSSTMDAPPLEKSFGNLPK